MTPKRASKKAEKVKQDQPVDMDLKQRDSRRFLTQLGLEEVLGWNRTTVRKWTAMENGLPYVVRGDRATKTEWLYDVRACVEWREKQVAEAIRAKHRPVEDPNDATGKAFLGGLFGKELVDAQNALIKLAEKRRYLVDPRAVADIMALYFHEIGTGCTGIPALARRDLSGYDDMETRRFITAAKASVDKQLKALSGWTPDALTDQELFWQQVEKDLKGFPEAMIDRLVRTATAVMPGILRAAQNTAEKRARNLMSTEGLGIDPDALSEDEVEDPDVKRAREREEA